MSAASRWHGLNPDPRVILISIDTLRADHLSAYGYRAIQTPQIRFMALRGATAPSKLRISGSWCARAVTRKALHFRLVTPTNFRQLTHAMHALH